MAEGLVYIGANDSRPEIRFTKAGQSLPTGLSDWNDTVSFAVQEAFEFNLNAQPGDEFDVTHWKSATKEKKTGFRDPNEITFTTNIVPVVASGGGDEGQSALIDIAYGGADNTRYWMVKLPLVDANNTDGSDNSFITFQGQLSTLGASMPLDKGSLNCAVKISGSFVWTMEERSA